MSENMDIKFNRQSFMKYVNNNFFNGQYENGLLKNAFKYCAEPENYQGFLHFYKESKFKDENKADHQLEYLISICKIFNKII